MGHYVDASVQTIIEGLARDPSIQPSALIPPTDTQTPPDDMALEKLQLPANSIPTISKTTVDKYTSPTLLLRRLKRPPMATRISMPSSTFDEDPVSPPPTEAILSPLPAANRLHAGHTPIIPRALSPLPKDESDPPSPVADEALSGPLFLPPQPGDGAEDTIPLTVLDAELEKLRIEQEQEEQQDTPALDQPPSESATINPNEPSPPNENIAQRTRSRQDSMDSRRPSADDVEVVDGVLLKKPKMNLGAPLGQA
jgi:hypothetical protein